MPPKTQKRIFRKIAVKHGAKKRPRRNIQKNITYLSPQLQPFPQRYTTKMYTSLFGFVTPGAGVTSGNYQLMVNACSQAFQNSAPGFPNPSSPVLTLNPTGFEQLCNVNFYSRYRVTGFSVRVEYIPQALTDTVIGTITPSTRQGTPGSTAVAQTQPFTKKGNFSSSKNNTNQRGGNSIILSMKCHNFIGVNKMIFDNDLSGQFTAPYNAQPARPIWVTFNWATPDNVALTNPLQYRIDLIQYVDLYEPTNAQLNQ